MGVVWQATQGGSGFGAEGGKWPSEERPFWLVDGMAGAKSQWQEGARHCDHWLQVWRGERSKEDGGHAGRPV